MWEVHESKPLAAGKFSNSPTYVKFDMRKVPRNAALTYVGEWLLVVRGCAVGDDVGDWYYEDSLHFTSEGDIKTSDC
jgi:hypothetical protein